MKKKNMINYKLAKRLKEAGFPQPNVCVPYEIYPQVMKPNGCPHWGTKEYGFRKDCGCFIYAPFLHRLIDACPTEYLDKEFDKQEEAEFFLCWTSTHWFAGYEYYEREYHPLETMGNSPEEAVAKLWLKLNES